jgi:hypothetical protein
VIGTALVLLFAALALSGTLARAAMARSHRDVAAFAVWCVSAVVIVLVALSAIFSSGTWARVYDGMARFISDR